MKNTTTFVLISGAFLPEIVLFAILLFSVAVLFKTYTSKEKITLREAADDLLMIFKYAYGDGSVFEAPDWVQKKSRPWYELIRREDIVHIRNGHYTIGNLK